MNRCDLPGATPAALLLLVSIPGAAYAGPLEDAEEAVRKGDYATAIPIYRSLAEKGDVSAQMRLGFFYESGAGLKRKLGGICKVVQQSCRWRRRKGRLCP